MLDEYVIAEEHLEKALSISKDIRDGEAEFDCYCVLALTKLSLEKFQEAFCCLFRSIEKCEDLRGLNSGSDEINISFADMHVFPYEWLREWFCNAGFAYHALSVTEMGRARALADLMATQYSAETHISANPQSWIGIENVMTKENNCTCLYISYSAERVLLFIVKTSGVVLFRETKVDKNTLHKRLAQPAKNLDEFFAIMAKSFRSFGILPEEVCEDRSLNDIETAEPDSSQEESHTALRDAKDEKNPEPSLTLFHEMLINPVSDLLDEPEIIIVPHRNLYRVPFAALLDQNGKYLSETFRIRIIPSLTTLKLIQDSSTDYHSQTGALIVGDPDVGEVIYCGSTNRNFVPLPGARKEAEMIGRLLGVHPLLGQHATKQAVLQRIDSVSLIHFAAHGSAERGEIALAPQGSTSEIPQEEDYLLQMSDISKVQLRAKLVVLSCCHSGRGQIKAEGAVGIARAFLGSGARSVLVALWALEDSATKQVMSCFYHHLVRGECASESLYRAMKWMRDKKWWRGNSIPEVSEWAPFMLIGDNVTFDFGK
ncbi:tetratricopeptide repeat protein 28-like [Oculina patagonica]